MRGKILKVFFFLIFLIIILISYSKISKKNKSVEVDDKVEEQQISKSNIINDVNYSSKDAKGNEYIVKASIGEIDYDKTNIIYLTNVKAYINLKNKETIKIVSNFGKYNIENFDTIFSKNVMIDYLENKIKSEYLDFSLERKSMIISKKVIYTNIKRELKADVIEIDLETRDTKIYMLENQNKVKIINKN